MAENDKSDIEEVELLTATEWSRWQAPAVSTEIERKQQAATQKQGAAEPLREGLMTPAQLEQLREQTYREAWEQGLREGYEAGQADIQEKAQHWQQLLESLAQPMEQLDQEVTYQLVLLTSAMARAVVEHDVMVNPAQIVDVVRKAIPVMPGSAQNLTVHVHPEDAALLREAFPADSDNKWSILENPTISRGGCEVHSDTSRIDERLETRLAKVVEEVMAEAAEAASGKPAHD